MNPHHLPPPSSIFPTSIICPPSWCPFPILRGSLRKLFWSVTQQWDPIASSSTTTSALPNSTDATIASLNALTNDGASYANPSNVPAAPVADTVIDSAEDLAGRSSSSSPCPVDDSGGDLANRLAGLVASRGLPVLMIHGLYDRLVPASNSQRLARMLSGCELVLLDRCGHMPQEEMPDIFVNLVAEFAARIPVKP